MAILINICSRTYSQLDTKLIYKSFNSLQNSAIKISAGDLNTDIFIPKGGMLYELALALSKMSERLKSQILEMRKLEAYRSEFIASVSHEVKTPLTGILSAVELLNEELPDKTPKTEKCLNILEKQSKKIKFFSSRYFDIIRTRKTTKN